MLKQILIRLHIMYMTDFLNKNSSKQNPYYFVSHSHLTTLDIYSRIQKV